MAGRIDPNWWHEEESLEQTIQQSLTLPKHRERWKYTRPEKVFALITDHTDAAETKGNLDIQALISDAPDALIPFLKGHGLDQKELADSETVDLSKAPGPLQVVVPASQHAALQRQDVSGFGNFLWLEVHDNASVEISLSALSHQSHWDSLHIYAGRDARVTLNLHNSGAEIARQDIQIHCLEPGADITINAAASVVAGAHLDQQVTMHHKAAHTSSRQTFHTAVAEKAQVTFNGRIHIYESCPGVDAHLSNRNLALAPSATINTKPELEIYTDDVACSHGATVGALEEAELFYCVSRGIPPELAQRMLGLGFLRTASAGPLSERAREVFEAALA